MALINDLPAAVLPFLDAKTLASALPAPPPAKSPRAMKELVAAVVVPKISADHGEARRHGPQ